VLRSSSILVSSNSRLNLNDNALIIDYTGASPLSAVGSMLQSGYANGAWNGSGIGSAVAASAVGTDVGFAEATELFTSFPATFADQSVDSTSVLIRYTLSGDADLNTNVNTVDFNILAANFGGTGKRWTRGDFNYDESVNTVDFNLLAANFSRSLPAAAPSVQTSSRVALARTSGASLFADLRIGQEQSLGDSIELNEIV
jgi:hypothetical protein